MEYSKFGKFEAMYNDYFRTAGLVFGLNFSLVILCLFTQGIFEYEIARIMCFCLFVIVGAFGVWGSVINEAYSAAPTIKIKIINAVLSIVFSACGALITYYFIILP